MSAIMSILFNTGLHHSTGCGISDNGHITGGECYCSACVCCVENVKKRNQCSKVRNYVYITICNKWIVYLLRKQLVAEGVYDQPTLLVKWVTHTLYITTDYHLIQTVLYIYVHRDGDIEMSDNTAYDTAHHTHVTCADESQYEDVNKLWVGVYNYNHNINTACSCLLMIATMIKLLLVSIARS